MRAPKKPCPATLHPTVLEQSPLDPARLCFVEHDARVCDEPHDRERAERFDALLFAARESAARTLTELGPRVGALLGVMFAARESAARTLTECAPRVHVIAWCIEAGFAVFGSLKRNRGERARRFLREWLRLNEMPEGTLLEALWIVLQQPAWKRATKPDHYLRRAVCREAKRLTAEREQQDRLWDRVVQVEDIVAVAEAAAFDGAYRVQDGLHPMSALEREPLHGTEQRRMLAAVASVICMGSDRDRTVIGALALGAEPAEAARLADTDLDGWRAFKRKVRSRLSKIPQRITH